MYVTVRCSRSLRAAFGNHDLEGILSTALERFAQRLKQVYLFLEDINGPRGGVDKQCRCVLHLRRLPPLVIEDRDESVVALVHRVANRAAYALSQATERRGPRAQRARHRGRPVPAYPGTDRLQASPLEPEPESAPA